MKIKTILLPLLSSVFVGSAPAATMFDIQSGSNTQSGFTGVSSFPGNDGTVTLAVDTVPSGFRDRGTANVAGSTYESVLRDLAFWSTSAPITFTLSGLAANTEYLVTAWSYDSAGGNDNKTMDFTTNGGTVSHTSLVASPVLNGFSLENLTSDGSGTATIVMDHTGGAGGSVSFVNGFQLDAIPEPSAALLGGLGVLALLRRRR